MDVSSVAAGARVKAVLSRLLEPAPEDRLQSAAAAAAALRGEGGLGLIEGDAVSTGVSASSPRGVLRQPKGSKVQLVRRGDEQLSITIPVSEPALTLGALGGVSRIIEAENTNSRSVNHGPDGC